MPSKKRQDAARKAVKEHDDTSNKPWVSNYPPLKEWLDKHEARCMWQTPRDPKPHDADSDWSPSAFIEQWRIGARPFIIIVYADKMGWEICTAADTNIIDATFLDAERRLGLVL